MKRWQQRAKKLLKAASSRRAGGATATATAAAAAKDGDEDAGEGEGVGAGLRGRIEAALAELEGGLKVSGVPEALELSALLQVRRGQGKVGGRGAQVCRETCAWGGWFEIEWVRFFVKPRIRPYHSASRLASLCAPALGSLVQEVKCLDSRKGYLMAWDGMAWHSMA